MKIDTLDGKTPDIAEENIKKLRRVFSDVFTEDKVDFEKLKQVLGNYVEDSRERYNFTWNGKGRALRLSQTPSLGTLRPFKEESKDWDTTQNLYIEGDNLEVLKLLQKSYHSKVKMIYIDPPYNTGKDFVYHDDFHDSLENYKRITGQVDDEGNRLSTNTEASGRYHTDWLNMMYPRLRLARNLLSDDGVIFISIDDNEVANLKKICDEVFGEDNFVAQINWRRKKEISSDSKNIAVQGEYILCYSKSDNALLAFEELSEEYIRKSYNEANDDFPLGKWRPVPITVSKGLSGGGYSYKIKTPTGVEHNRLWAYPEESYNELLEKGRVYFGKDNNGIPQRVIYADESKGQPVTNYWDDIATNKEGKKDILAILGDNYFDTPKPTGLIKKMIGIASDKNSIILDFFSGSSTTAHAVMQLNAEDGGNRKFIMVQLPELTDGKSEAYKAGYKNICEIGKERIRRAGDKIQEENKDKENIENLDIGFKVLKLDTSNIRKWQPDYDNLEQSLIDYIDHYVEGRTELDVVYEIMIKYGLDLTYPVDEFIIDDKKVYSIGFGMLMICLDDEITAEVAKGILEKVKELNPESTRVVFKDNGFKTDSNKTNIKEILKCGGIEEFITL
mgnify:CR=1 FL=1